MRRWRPSCEISVMSSRTRCCRSPIRRSSRWTSCGTSRTPAATRSRCSTRSRIAARRIPRARRQGELRDRIADAIAALPEREKLVVALYYYENLTLREIGEVLGVTESRVSQLHTKAVLRLRSKLGPRAGLTRPAPSRGAGQYTARRRDKVAFAHRVERSQACTRPRIGSATWPSSATAAVVRPRCTRRCCSRPESSTGSGACRGDDRVGLRAR